MQGCIYVGSAWFDIRDAQSLRGHDEGTKYRLRLKVSSATVAVVTRKHATLEGVHSDKQCSSEASL